MTSATVPGYEISASRRALGGRRSNPARRAPAESQLSAGTSIAVAACVRSSLARVHPPAPDDDFESIAVPADPNGLAYDPRTATLYVADGGGAVFAVAHGQARRIATIDAAGCVANQLGGIAVAPDGTIWVARLGHGHAGAIFEITPGGRMSQLPGLSPQAWHLGLTYDAAAHALYATRYDKRATGPCDGAVIRIDLATGAVTSVLADLCKPVGVARIGDELWVSDARRGTMLCATLGARGRVGSITWLAGIDRPDSVAACSDGVVLTTYDPETGIGSVCRVASAGAVTTLATGVWQPRGIACDGTHAFVAIRGAGQILVVPV